MNSRQRFKQICHFERPNDPFILTLDSWNEAYERWVQEGMPVQNLDNRKEVNVLLLGYQDQNECISPHGAIMAMGKNNNPPWCVAIDPVFEQTVISEDEEHLLEVDFDGAIVRRRKTSDTTIPQYLEYPVKDKKTWEEYKKRLDPFSPGRWPAGWEIMTDDKLGYPIKPEQIGKHWEERDFALGMNLLSLYGNLRNYMGLENLSYAIFDNIALVEEIIEWQAWLAYEMAKKVFEAGVTIEWVWIWEDMCFKGGSLVSPTFVKKHMVPHYRKVVDLLRAHGVDALILDSDGNVEELLPIWIDVGINAIDPLECAAGMDVLKLQKKYGKDLITMGNVDKRALAHGKSEIDAELEKCRKALEFGGFFPDADHHVPPDVPYENLVYFLNELRKLSHYEETRRVIPS